MLYIYCAGALGKEVYDLSLRNKHNKEQILFVDDLKYGDHFTSDKVPIVSEDTLFERFTKDDKVIIASGEPALREKIYKRLTEHDLEFETLIDKTVPISKSAFLGEGLIIFEFCSISSDAHLNNNVLINRQSIVGHDINIGESTVISSTVNIGGGVSIGNCSYIGMGATIKEGLKIGNNSILSMGSVLFRDLSDDIIAMGNPARTILKNKDRKIFK